MKKIGYSDFIRICRIERVDTWCSWLSVRGDGIYIQMPDDDTELTPEERAVLTEHPADDLTKPALSFPCDLPSLVAFLEQQAIGIDIDDVLGYETAQRSENVIYEIKSKSAAQAQDETILSILRSKGYNPLALPPYKPGKAGVKAEIRKVLGNKGMWVGKTVFNKAWERLKANDDIAYQK